MKKISISEIVKTVINCAILPLYFIKFIHEVAILPGFDEDGKEVLGRHDYYLSIYGEMCRAGLEFVFWLAFSFCLASIALSISRIFVNDNRAIKISSHIVFAISLIFFLVQIFLMLYIQYDY